METNTLKTRIEDILKSLEIDPRPNKNQGTQLDFIIRNLQQIQILSAEIAQRSNYTNHRAKLAFMNATSLIEQYKSLLNNWSEFAQEEEMPLSDELKSSNAIKEHIKTNYKRFQLLYPQYLWIELLKPDLDTSRFETVLGKHFRNTTGVFFDHIVSNLGQMIICYHDLEELYGEEEEEVKKEAQKTIDLFNKYLFLIEKDSEFREKQKETLWDLNITIKDYIDFHVKQFRKRLYSPPD